MYVCMYVCIYTNIYIYIYVYIYFQHIQAWAIFSKIEGCKKDSNETSHTPTWVDIYIQIYMYIYTVSTSLSDFLLDRRI
jgi:hypothetical protein